MPVLEVNGAQTYYELLGRGDLPALVFSNSLGTNLRMWDPQVGAVSNAWRILRYDTRGHGRTSATPGPYMIDQLADDVVRLIDQLELDRVSFCGLSMGGMIGMALALRAPERLSKLVLCNTSPKIGSVETWNMRIATVQKSGMSGVVDAVLERWYTAPFRAAFPGAVEAAREMFLNTPPDGYTACCTAIRDMDQREAIAGIRVPTLIIVGAHDPVTTPADGHFMSERIQGSKCVELPAAHLSNIEAADAFTKELTAFLNE